MLKILIAILVMTAFYRMNNKLPCNKSAAEECTVIPDAEPTSPQVFAEPQIENKISSSAIDGSRPFNPQLTRPTTVSWAKIKDDWIELDKRRNTYYD